MSLHLGSFLVKQHHSTELKMMPNVEVGDLLQLSIFSLPKKKLGLDPVRSKYLLLFIEIPWNSILMLFKVYDWNPLSFFIKNFFWKWLWKLINWVQNVLHIDCCRRPKLLRFVYVYFESYHLEGILQKISWFILTSSSRFC